MRRRRRTLRTIRRGSLVICGRESCGAVLATVDHGTGIVLDHTWVRRMPETWVRAKGASDEPVTDILLLKLPARIECPCGAEQTLDPMALKVPASLVPILGDVLDEFGVDREAGSIGWRLARR